MKSDNEEVFVKLTKTPKLVDFIKVQSPKTKLISFKLLNNVSHQKVLYVGRGQLERTSSSLVVANDLVDIKRGNHKALMISKYDYDVVSSKESIAKYIKNYVQY